MKTVTLPIQQKDLISIAAVKDKMYITKYGKVWIVKHIGIGPNGSIFQGYAHMSVLDVEVVRMLAKKDRAEIYVR